MPNGTEEIAERHGIGGVQKSFQKRPEGSQNERHSLNSTESEWDKAADQFEVVVRSRGHGMQDAPPWVLQQLTQSKAYKRLHMQNKKHKTGGYHPVQTMACPTEDSGTLTLAGERVQLPKRRTGRHSEVLRQGDQRVAVTRILGPKWTGSGAPHEIMAHRVVKLPGRPAICGTEQLHSGILQCGETKFTLWTEGAPLERVGILTFPMAQECNAEVTVKLWIVMQIWSHGRQHQVLVKETGINRRRRKEETDMGSWWAKNFKHHEMGSSGAPLKGQTGKIHRGAWQRGDKNQLECATPGTTAI